MDVRLRRYSFTFSGVISAKKFGKLKPLLKNFFNQIGFGISLKYKQKERMADKVDKVDKVMTWAEANNMPVRGHALVYPGWKFMHKMRMP